MPQNMFATELKQNNAVSPHMIQFVSVIQMNADQLSEYVNNAVLDNPVMDIVHPVDDTKKGIYYKDMVERPLVSHPGARNQNNAEGDFVQNVRGVKENYESLQLFLTEQLSRMKPVSEKMLPLCEWIIRRLDKKGFLQEEDWETLQSCSLAETALELIQGLEPAGIGARNVQECLLLQLQRSKEDTHVAEAIVGNHLPLFEKQQYKKLASLLACSVTDIKKAAEQILQLQPYPAVTITEDADLQPEYIYPDAQVEVNESGELEIYLSRAANIQISVNQYYTQLYKTTTDEAVREYLKERINGARWLERCLQQRTKTYQDCVYEIVNWQKAYFLNQADTLKPMRMREIAEKLDVHVSTISRVIRDSYIQSNKGTIMLKSLFSGAVGGTDGSESYSVDYIKNRVSQLIKEEDAQLPLSDQSIAEVLLQENIRISRRAIAKYRSLLGIPNQHRRRER